MKKYTLLLSLLVVSSLAFAQGKEKKKKKKKKKAKVEVVTTASGLKYQINHDAGGKKALPGDKLTVHYTGRLTNDTIFDSSVRRGEPFTFELGGGRVIKGWEEGFKFLGVGDKAILTVPPDLGYGNQSTGKIPPNATLIFDVEVLSIKEGIRPWDITGKDTLSTGSGLKYVKVSENPDGTQAVDGDIVKVHYSGFLINGKKFDSSVERGQPFEFKLGQGRVIKGWEEGIALLKEGEKAKLIIPHQLGYGERQSGPIPPKSTLIFDVELVGVTKIEKPKPYPIEGKEVVTTESGLKYIVVEKSNSGVSPGKGKSVVVHYTGYLDDGKIFDSSVERGQPFQFPVGEGKVIPGWEEGMPLMQQGDKFRFIIPANLAYGERGFPPTIPPNATITFDVELILVYDTPANGGGHQGHNHDHGSHEGHNH